MNPRSGELVDAVDAVFSSTSINYFHRLRIIMGRGKTQKLRTNRPDGRAISSKTRHATLTKNRADESIQDIKVTRVQKDNKIDRSFNISAMPLKRVPIETEKPEKKKIRALRKTLKDLESLLKYQDEGGTLSANQTQRLETLDDTLDEFTRLSDLVAAEEEELIKRRAKDEESDEDADSDTV